MIEPSTSPPLSWRNLLLLALIVTPLLLLRGALISHAQSERFDDGYHLSRGVAYLTRTLGDRSLNDPPLGEALSAIPLWITGSIPSEPSFDQGIYGHRLSPETLLMLVALWKSLLFMPLVLVIARWASELYGKAAGIVAATLLMLDPTFAAHVPIGAIDVLGVEGIVIACCIASHYIQRPTLRRLIIMCAAVSVAMMLKHTAIILPGVIGVMAIAWWWIRPRFVSETSRDREGAIRCVLASIGVDGHTVESLPHGRGSCRMPLKTQLAHVALACVLVPMMIWALTLFDVSRPMRPNSPFESSNSLAARVLKHTLPAGTYIRSFATGANHGVGGHAGYLNGENRPRGWWYYHLVVSLYKMPFGVWVILGGAVASFARVRVRAAEWLMLLSLFAYLAFTLSNSINIGYRHFLPVLALLIVAMSRMVTLPRARHITLAGLSLAAIQTLMWHPNYLSFSNPIRAKPYLAMSDSNVDWGQALLQLREWEAQQSPDREISFASFTFPDSRIFEHYLAGSRVKVVMYFGYSDPQPAPLPTRGLFVVSPVCLAGAYDQANRLRPLWDVTPIETIGGSLLVFDLDATPIAWPASDLIH